MGFFSFLKKIKNTKKPGKKETEAKKMRLSELEEWKNNQLEEGENRKKEIINEIKSALLFLIDNLEKEINILRGIDLEKRKVEEKVRLIVKENLRNYVGYTENLLEKIKKISQGNTNNLDELIDKINFVLSEFNKKSALSFEKATFLIGKEIADVRESINKFFRNIDKILESNKTFIKNLETIKYVEEKGMEIQKIEKRIKENRENIRELEEKQDKFDKAIKNLVDEIEKMRKSREYEEREKIKEEIFVLKSEISREISKLKNAIDFKTLARILHVNEKKMSILKEHKENFSVAFEKDSGEKLLSLIKDIETIKPNYCEISQQINKIIALKKELLNKENKIGKDPIQEFEDKIKKTKLESYHLKQEKLKELKKSEKLSDSRDKAIEILKQALKKINIALEF